MNIHQIWLQGADHLNSIDINGNYRSCMRTWRAQFARYKLWDFTEIMLLIDGIRSDMRPVYLELMNSVKLGTNKASYAILSDYARLIILYECGGLYADIDCFCSNDFLLKELARRDSKLILASGVYAGKDEPSVCNNFIYSTKGNPTLKDLILFQRTHKNVIDVDYSKIKPNEIGQVINCSGPAVILYWAKMRKLIANGEFTKDVELLLCDHVRADYGRFNEISNNWVGETIKMVKKENRRGVGHFSAMDWTDVREKKLFI